MNSLEKELNTLKSFNFTTDLQARIIIEIMVLEELLTELGGAEIPIKVEHIDFLMNLSFIKSKAGIHKQVDKQVPIKISKMKPKTVQCCHVY